MFTIIGGDGREYGPVSTDKIRGWIAAGRADLSTQAKADGTVEWKPLGDYPEFAAGEAAAVPPPLAGPAGGAEPAGRGARLAAAVIDWIFLMVWTIPAMRALAHTEFYQAVLRGEQPDMTRLADMNPFLQTFWLCCLGAVATQSVLLSLRSQSLGKIFLGIRIARQGAGAAPAGFLRTVVLRTWLPFALAQLPFFGLMFGLVDVVFIFGEERRCVHDLIAGTKVVRVPRFTRAER